MFRHWNAGRSQVQINEALNIDRKTIRKYLAVASTKVVYESDLISSTGVS
jgi:DNA-binding transcriptional regulator LsrR (DeoR family)